VRPRGGRRDRQISPHGDQAVYDALVRLARISRCVIRWWRARANFGNVDGDNPPRCATPKQGSPTRPRRCWKGWTKTQSISARRMTALRKSLLFSRRRIPICWRTLERHRSRHGDLDPAAQSGRAVRRDHRADRKSKHPRRHAAEICERPRFPHRRHYCRRLRVDRRSLPHGHGSFASAPAGTRRTASAALPARRRSGSYQIQKAKLIERIAELIEQKKVPLLDDVHDESAEDIRIVLMPKSRVVEPELLMEQLFRQTDLESRIPLNMNVLDKGLVPARDEPEGGACAFVAHRREVLERRTKHRLEKIAARLEVLEGYLAVYLNLDKVIKIIRGEDEPKPVLMKAFKLTENQAEAILNMRLRSLRKLEEMEIAPSTTRSPKEEKELKKLLGSDTLKSGRMIAELKGSTPSSASRPRSANAARRSPRPSCREDRGDRRRSRCHCLGGRARAHHHRLFGEGLAARLQGHQEPSDAIKYREATARASGSTPRRPTN